MVASKHIENKVAELSPAVVFTISDLGFPADWWENIRVKLGRMVESGKIKKVAKGKYYKPKKTIFGNLGPDVSEVVKDLMYDNGILSGYTTGYVVWNKMGLTTQISNVIVIGTSRRREPLRRGQYQVRFIAQPNRITSDNIPLLQILDSLKLIKQIPDTTIDRSISVLKNMITRLEEKKVSLLVKLSKKYPPRVRALLGAIMQSDGRMDYARELKQTLNPTTVYTFGLRNSKKLNLTDWNII